jgi:hypothetical protein
MDEGQRRGDKNMSAEVILWAVLGLIGIVGGVAGVAGLIALIRSGYQG